MSDKTIVHASDWMLTDITVRSASTFALTIGEVRRLVAEADRLAVPDAATVYVEGVSKSYGRVDEYCAKVVHVRHQRKPSVAADE